MRIIKEGSTVNIDQCAYLDTVLERCGMQDAKSAATPLLAGYMPDVRERGTGGDSPVRPRGNPQPQGVLLSIYFNAY